MVHARLYRIMIASGLSGRARCQRTAGCSCDTTTFDAAFEMGARDSSSSGSLWNVRVVSQAMQGGSHPDLAQRPTSVQRSLPSQTHGHLALRWRLKHTAARQQPTAAAALRVIDMSPYTKDTSGLNATLSYIPQRCPWVVVIAWPSMSAARRELNLEKSAPCDYQHRVHEVPVERLQTLQS
ncbi:hypothetical protein K466DRAFT_349637 [Polyporus arcularius HHB13444]|uniref:Uncharacterized protein n=1 Tax=Polyporus arcularius HHB13444 TaxID=1314778 RepID=A0A5C3NVR9_9APHY|nr:hypothetical protein K466DRAFT_349637 [Polyporus arcularius HHB13444]